MSVTVILFSFAFYAIWRCNTSNARGAARGDRGARSRARNADRSRRTAKAYPYLLLYEATGLQLVYLHVGIGNACDHSTQAFSPIADFGTAHSARTAASHRYLHTLGVVRPLRARETRGLGRCRPLTADCRACV